DLAAGLDDIARDVLDLARQNISSDSLAFIDDGAADLAQVAQQVSGVAAADGSGGDMRLDRGLVDPRQRGGAGGARGADRRVANMDPREAKAAACRVGRSGRSHKGAA